jgi:hypothetical protein
MRTLEMTIQTLSLFLDYVEDESIILCGTGCGTLSGVLP